MIDPVPLEKWGTERWYARDIKYVVHHPIRAVANVLSDPLEAWTLFQDRFAAGREGQTSPDLYRVEGDWERRLHDLLGVPWLCEANSEFWALWSESNTGNGSQGDSSRAREFQRLE